MSDPVRIVIVKGCGEYIVAHNSWFVATEIDESGCGNDPVDLGVCQKQQFDGPGVYLWEGKIVSVKTSAWDDPPEYEPRYDGTLRKVRADEIEGLLAMQPPMEEDHE